MTSQRTTQEFREPPPRRKASAYSDDHRYESPVPRRVSAFRPYDTTLQDKSPFHRFIEEQLQELPQTNARVTRNLAPPELIIYQTPDRQLHHVVGFGINQRLSFDLLSPNPRSHDMDIGNEVIESSDEQDDEGGSISESAESSSAGQERVENDLPQKTPVKEPNSHHLSRQKTQARESATQQPKHNICCNCKKSRCLKLYCDCFRSNQVCQGCNCVSCLNTHEHQEERYSAMLAILEINQEAFKPKILVEKHAKGCNCKKSGCLKKYCECYQAGLKCSELCKCEDCKNAKTREQRDPPKSRQRGTIKKESRYDSHTKKLIS